MGHRLISTVYLGAVMFVLIDSRCIEDSSQLKNSNPLFDKPVDAIAAFNSEKNGKIVAGIVNFHQKPESPDVHITGSITGLIPGKEVIL